MRKTLLMITLVSFKVFFSQSVGIGTTSPISTLDIVTKTNLSTNNVLKIVNTDNKTIFSGLDNGDFGIGKTQFQPIAQLTIFGTNNNKIASQPSYFAKYDNNPQRWGIYINPKQDDLNPAYPGFISMIFDNDGVKDNYFSANNYGTFFGYAGSAVATGIFFAENGSTFFSSYRIDTQANKGYLTTTKVTAYTNGALRIQDENKNYLEGETCVNPGTIAFNSVDNKFLGCAEIYDTNGINTGVKIWKKLNNN